MKNKLLIIVFSILFLLPVRLAFSQNVGDTAYININNIYLPFDNKGVIAYVNVLPLGPGGHLNGEHFLYSAGFYLSGVLDSVWTNGVMPNTLIQDYQPGTISIEPNDPRASIYKLKSDDPPFGPSWQDWIDAVDLGADFYDGDGNGIYNPVDLNGNNQWDPDEDKPDILGDEIYWCAYNDGVPIEDRRWSVEPLGIEIKQTIFAFETSQLPLSNVVFIRYKIINSGSKIPNLTDVIFGHPYDVDLGDINDDLGGTDIGRNAHYCYNDSSDLIFGDNPPVFFADFLSGPATYIPGVSFIDQNGNGSYENGIDIPLDTAYTYSGSLGVQVYVGATNVQMLAGVTYADGDPYQGEPRNPVEARNYLKGLQRRGAEADPCTYPYGEVRGGIDCHTINPYYWYSGDPVNNMGWINTTPTENHAIFSLKPFQLLSNKVKEVMIAYIVGQGTSALNSITVAKSLSDEIQDLYEDNFGYPIVLTNDDISSIDNYKLEQNFPNPFNPNTTIKYQIPEISFITIKVYDVLGNEIATLVREEKPSGNYEVMFNASELSSGIYFYTLHAGKFIQTKKMMLLK